MSCSRGRDHSRRQGCRRHTRAFSGGSSSHSSLLVSSVSKLSAIDNLKSRSFSRCFLGTSRSLQSSLYRNHAFMAAMSTRKEAFVQSTSLFSPSSDRDSASGHIGGQRLCFCCIHPLWLDGIHPGRFFPSCTTFCRYQQLALRCVWKPG